MIEKFMQKAKKSSRYFFMIAWNTANKNICIENKIGLLICYKFVTVARNIEVLFINAWSILTFGPILILGFGHFSLKNL